MIELVSSILTEPLGLSQKHAEQQLPAIAHMLSHSNELKASNKPSSPLTGIYHDGKLVQALDSKEQAPMGSTAVMQFDGVLWSWTYKWYIRMLNDAATDESIKNVIVLVNSPGGSVYGVKDLASAVAHCKARKPVYTLVTDGLMCSAAYGALCGSTGIYASSSTCEIGSIGTYTTLVDYSEYFTKNGIKVVDLYAAKSTKKNEEWRAFQKGDSKPMQAWLDELNTEFTSHVVNARPNINQANTLNGQTYFAAEAQANGLIDGVMTIYQLLEKLANGTAINPDSTNVAASQSTVAQGAGTGLTNMFNEKFMTFFGLKSKDVSAEALAVIEAKSEELSTKVEALSTDLTALQATNAALVEEKTQLTSQLAAANTQIETLQKEVTRLGSQPAPESNVQGSKNDNPEPPKELAPYMLAAQKALNQA